MTKDEVISLYVLANGWNPEGWPNTVDELQRFATFVEDQARADEREACAKLCEELDHIGTVTQQDCAEAIRARGQA